MTERKESIDDLVAACGDKRILTALKAEKLRQIDRFEKIRVMGEAALHLDGQYDSGEQRRMIELLCEVAGSWCNQLCDEDECISERMASLTAEGANNA